MSVLSLRVLSSLVAFSALFLNVEQVASAEPFKFNPFEISFNSCPIIVSTQNVMFFASTDKTIEQKLIESYDLFDSEKLKPALKDVTKEFHTQDEIDFVIAFPVAPRDTYEFSLAVADELGKPIMVKHYKNAAELGQKLSKMQVMKLHFAPNVKLSKGIYFLQMWVSRNGEPSGSVNYQFKLV